MGARDFGDRQAWEISSQLPVLSETSVETSGCFRRDIGKSAKFLHLQVLIWLALPRNYITNAALSPAARATR